MVTEDNNYVLAVNPTPPMHDVLMLYYQDKNKETEEGLVIYKDYGLTVRQEMLIIPEEIQSLVARLDKEIKEPVSKVNTSQFDVKNPLTPHEWKLWHDVVSATKGHGFMQVLPVGYASNQPFKNNLLHILPNKGEGWGRFKIPLGTMINLREEYYKKENKRVYEETQKKREEEAKNTESLTEAEKEMNEEMKKQEDLVNEHIYKYSSKNIFRLVEYDFPHCVCILDSNPSDNSLFADFMKISEELNLEKHENCGITIILHSKWMFAAPLTTPYTTLENGIKLFVDPFSYGGIMNFHIKQHEWPQSAGIHVDAESSKFKKNILISNFYL